MVPLLILVTLCLTLPTGETGSIRYEQAQTGDTNVHLQIKNVEVLALLDDSLGAEYDYDYNDFTEKPTKPSSNSSWSTGLSPPPPPSPSSSSSTNTSSPSAPGSEVPSVAPGSETPLLNATEPPATQAPTTVSAVPSTTKKTRRCGAGFYRDTLGRCRRVRRPHLQRLIALARSKKHSENTQSSSA